ncbi:MAG: rhamnulose-1-phosphate aldolase [Bacteroidota bacterium]|nr:rhamnulose-1-phosphate aldolase [Bacteroidota bacterium]
MNTIFDNKQLQEKIHDVAELADYLWQKGWAERNAGNISINLCDILKDVTVTDLEKYPEFKLKKALPGLKGGFFFVTGTGKRMRDLARNPLLNACVIRISDKGDSYRIISQNDINFYELRPTSELPTHLGIHEQMVKNGSKNRVIVHTHPNELIALSHSPMYKSEDVLNRILWGMHPESVIVVPRGVGMVPYEIPGTTDIAELTIKALADHDVLIWEKHGCLAVGEELFDTFDLIDTLSKSAQIFIYAKSAGFEPEGLTENQLLDLKKAFHVGGY